MDISNFDTERRRFLSGLAAIGVGALAGCSGDQSKPQQRETQPPNQETSNYQTERPSEPQYLPENGSINAIPSNRDREWSNANVFNILDGEVNYEINLEKARGRHYDDIKHWSQVEQETETVDLGKFVDNVLTNPDWRKKILDEAAEEYGKDHLEDTFKPEEYKKDAPFDQRLKDSKFQDFWYRFEDIKFGGVSSTHNEAKASVIQTLEQKVGKDTIVWGNQSGHGGHGLITTLENPTYNEDEFDQQNTYVVETDPRRDHQVMNLAEEGYQNSGIHPSEGGRDVMKQNLWTGLAMTSDDNWEKVNPSIEGSKEFADFLINPSSDSGQKYMDLMATAYDLSKDERLEDKEVRIGSQKLSYS